MNQIIRKYRAAAAGLALLIASGLAGIASAQTTQKEDAAPTRSRADSGEIKSCVECHEGFYAIARTKHAVKGDARTPESTGKSLTGNPEDKMCSSCHGDLSAHLKTPRVKGLVPVVFGKKGSAEPQNEACLGCHQSGSRIHWQGSKHEQTKQSCASCHRLHAPKDPVMVAETQASVCFDCHKDRRAELHRVSTHPTKNGFFSCSACHAPHGSTAQRGSLQKNTVNETCYTCHAQLRGPFLWEHRPSQDDCTNCHNPHGTNIAPMLKVRMPYLCQQCHSTAIGHSNVAFDGSTLAPTSGSAQRILGNACANCHMKVHGSNHPSGARLQR
ncbi:DmsE family decaheme c-type cytochrome [Sulfuritalea sp.]|uniref:DmsE family decaheme c-type cytochrome n=1 Tax=Sulfuritalea sp. TaxID=2480090 RepID=UPI00286DF3EB|nr:DmsE family decaheme c-type cytochrome [Sulfuritalea sp.]